MTENTRVEPEALSARRVDDNGQITGRIVIDTKSIDTKSKRRDAHLRGTDFFDVQKYG
jgi:polyisoprenoid-binding protein YceI